MKVTPLSSHQSIFLKLLESPNHRVASYQHVDPKENSWNQSALQAHKNASELGYSTLPLFTYTSYKMITIPSDHGGYMSMSGGIRFLGAMTLLPSIVLDLVKTPFTATMAVEEAVRSGVCQFIGYLKTPDADAQQMEALLKSLVLRVDQASQILISLGLLQEDDWKREIENNVSNIIALSLVLTAIASTTLDNQSQLKLANQKILKREDCPQGVEELNLFDDLLELRNILKRDFITQSPEKNAQVLSELFTYTYNTLNGKEAIEEELKQSRFVDAVRVIAEQTKFAEEKLKQNLKEEKSLQSTARVTLEERAQSHRNKYRG